MPNIKFARHEDDRPLMSSAMSIKQEVKNSFLWRDIVHYLEDRIELHRRNLEGAEDMSTVIRSQAIIANCRDLLDLPELFLVELESDKAIED